MKYFAEPCDDVGGWSVGHKRHADGASFLSRACTEEEAKVMVAALNTAFYPEGLDEIAQMTQDMGGYPELSSTETQLANIRTIVTRLYQSSERYADVRAKEYKLVETSIFQELLDALVIVGLS